MSKKKAKGTKAGDVAVLNKNRGSGFEYGYADPPMTPAEHVVEKKLYNSNRPFPERIEECIQRYMARRRLNRDRRMYFSKYLALGGIDTLQRQFTGTADVVKEMKQEGDFDADHARQITASASLSTDPETGKFYNPARPEHWEVDFSGVVSGFIGDWLIRCSGADELQAHLAVDTIQNFLRYVKYHDVCPEYKDDLEKACNICELARNELLSIVAAGGLMPGDFNLACQILFCSNGEPAESSWRDSSDDEAYYELKTYDGAECRNPWERGITAPKSLDANRVFQVNIAIHEPGLIDRVLEQKENPIHVIKTYEDDFAVKSIFMPDAHLSDIFRDIKDKSGRPGNIRPTGRVVLSPTIIEDGWNNHRTQAEGHPAADQTVTLYFDDIILKELKKGMKLRLTVCMLNIGLEFVRNCDLVLPTFHCFLPQSLMLDHYKPHQLSDRPPPQVDNAEEEELNIPEEGAKDEKEPGKTERKVAQEKDAMMKVLDSLHVTE